ncbi:hypothetical protein [Sandaracinus amylolyticus]|uniref:hypothetical protein n=1 Tax=Sandaracinus amylolyticus TaxID=927083 RepID=UPI001F1D0376|nr:hypothetical protein [Sandaracinus amylolyticus]
MKLRCTSLTRSLVSLSLAATLGACGSEEPAAPELDLEGAAHGGEAVLATALVFDVADALGDLGTLVASSPVETIAGNIHGNALRVVQTCGTVTIDGTTVSAIIQAEGCELPPPTDPEAPPPVWVAPGGATEGSMEMVATRDGEDLVLTVAIEGLVVHDRTFDGTATLRSDTGISWTVAVDVDVTGGEVAHVTSDVIIDPTPSSRTIDGTITVEGATEAETTSYDANDVEWARDACYPSDGSLRFEDASGRETHVAFDEATATSGVATVRFSGTSAMPEMLAMDVTLPAYGECP